MINLPPAQQAGVPVVEERMVIRKQLFLTAEIRLTRKSSVRQEPQELTLRREELIVERLNPATGKWHNGECVKS